MVRRHAPTLPDADPEERAATEAQRDDRSTDGTAVRDLPDLSSLPIAGLTRRRLAGILGAMLAVWIVVVFARQVGDASAAAARVDQMHVDNASLATEVAALTRELDQIKRQRFIEQEARAHGLGSAKEVAFTLAEDAPPLPEDAPGSASVRLGALGSEVTPLDRWLTLLFGPGG
jgi:cell division protein FtsB